MKTIAFLASIMFCAILGAALPESGDRVLIGDFEYVLVRSSDWVTATNNLATCLKVWDKLNATEQGRLAVHGRQSHTTITNGEVTVTYADGYRRTEKAKVNAMAKKRQKPTSTSKSEPRRVMRTSLPQKFQEIIARREAALTTTNHVTEIVGGGK